MAGDARPSSLLLRTRPSRPGRSRRRTIPDQLCLNAGAPLLRDHTGHRPPGFLEIVLEGPAVLVRHHAWHGADWSIREIRAASRFFDGP